MKKQDVIRLKQNCILHPVDDEEYNFVTFLDSEKRIKVANYFDSNQIKYRMTSTKIFSKINNSEIVNIARKLSKFINEIH